MNRVFSHGRLRLYLLKLLDESPRHGYDVIRLLEDRFMGLYAPSPGTIYPRLQRLEAEGLVTHSTEGGRKVYRITDAGREELAARRDDGGWERDWDWHDGGALDLRLAEFLDRTSKAMRRVRLTEAQMRECAAILDEAFERIRQTLKDPDKEQQP